MTDAEPLLWSRVRGKQIGPVPFCRQKPLDDYIVDFLRTRSHPRLSVVCHSRFISYRQSRRR
jgi:very-short-patch-repair endonuclease